MSNGFQRVLDHIRSIAASEAEKGRLFERLMKTYFTLDPIYRDRFANVWLWPEWAATRPEFDGADIGIDLVAEEREDAGYCAIQCKCYAPDTRISKTHLDSFISASAREPFTARIVVDTGDEWGPNAVKTITRLKPACAVLRFDDLATHPFDWPNLVYEQPEALTFRTEPFSLRPHQKAAFDDVLSGFTKHDRGKLIMACGTGKTFTALRIAEAVSEIGGQVLYLVPSISLFQQSMREWATHRNLVHRYVGICSDTRAGRNDEDASLQELEIPVTTDPVSISWTLQNTSKDALTVVFCTYHSLELIEKAQDDGAPAFDLIICDEAHRTTGIEHPADSTSPFVLVHDKKRIQASKRLYMTATPRLFTESAKTKAARHDIEVYSMDDLASYGPEFHRLQFSRAVEQNLLSDYKVVVLAMSEQHVDKTLQAHLASIGGEINLTDAAQIVGCWRALQNPENKRLDNGAIRPLNRAIAFTNTILSSKRLEAHWDGIIEQAIGLLPEYDQARALRCETRHVDGKHHALERKARIEWLKGSSDRTCRILSNARCLSEGIDVPALDAVLFMNPRRSQVDIVQAVGRAMRKSEGKEYGYIILPIVVPAGADPATVLDDNKRFATVWGVLRALRSHDDRFEAEINQIDLNNTPTPRIIFSGDGFNGHDLTDEPELLFPALDLPPGAIYAKIVEKCGDRKYWETWAKDVAAIFARLFTRINGLLEDPENSTLLEWFGAFHDELKVSINESITRDDAIYMMAQHIITRPVFEALFEKYDFAGKNPVAQSLDSLNRDFGEFGLENETRDLSGFYESVQLRARGLDNSEARQRVLMELYEKFFATAMKKDAARLGIVYTPVEVVDFILASADKVLRDQFDRSLSDDGVHVLDPFTGTGIFIVRLLQSALIQDMDLNRKFHEELHANEIVLLAYYIAAIHIEEAFHGRLGDDKSYQPFNGIVLTDTFNLHTDRTGFPKAWLPDNSKRVERQQELPIQVVVGNPPWSAGQKSSADDNPNVDYPELEKRIAATYVRHSTATNKNSLYDTYKMAIRWASDRIGEQGIVAFVTNGSWIDGNADSGVRACLAKEFNTIYVLNLRGNQRTQGERSRMEGGKIFGQGSRAPVAITILVRNPNVDHGSCRILYHDIGDYLKREEKLSKIREAGSISGIDNWQEISPDKHNDWTSHRDKAFQRLYPMGLKEVKSGKSDNAIFELFSRGFETARDAYMYNFSIDVCSENARAMVTNYLDALEELRTGNQQNLEFDEIVRRNSTKLRWDEDLKKNLRQQQQISYSTNKIWRTQYRPFVKQNCYVDYVLAHRKAQMDRIFPTKDSENRAICVPGVGSTKPFSALVTNTMPDLELVSKGQCFPRYRFEHGFDNQSDLLDDTSEFRRVDNITDTALKKFRIHYNDSTITKDAIFDYVYGILHDSMYRERFVSDLAKGLPRIPMVSEFYAFADAGRALAKLHLNYETCEEYSLQTEIMQSRMLREELYRITGHKMRFADENKTSLIVNDYVKLTGIPSEAHKYQVNGRTPIEWFIDRYKITRDSNSGIVNDPNDWFDSPEDLISSFKRIVYLSVETVRIIESLPNPSYTEVVHDKFENDLEPEIN